MRRWRVKYKDMTEEAFEADSYDAVVGTFRNDGVSVAWINTEMVKSVREVPDTDKADAVRGAGVPKGIDAR